MYRFIDYTLNILQCSVVTCTPSCGANANCVVSAAGGTPSCVCKLFAHVCVVCVCLCVYVCLCVCLCVCVYGCMIIAVGDQPIGSV